MLLWYNRATNALIYFVRISASIAMSNTSSGVGSSIRLGPSNNTFVHCVIKMASKYGGKLLNNSTGHGNLASCQILFSLLKNMAMTSECRGIMWKVES
jgi:hypothetical protein